MFVQIAWTFCAFVAFTFLCSGTYVLSDMWFEKCSESDGARRRLFIFLGTSGFFIGVAEFMGMAAVMIYIWQ